MVLLLRLPDLLLLDEPTNHLDFASLAWLEEYLAQYRGGMLAISHDRWFIHRFGGQLWELANGTLVKHEENLLVGGEM